jgi:hypothetical protein
MVEKRPQDVLDLPLPCQLTKAFVHLPKPGLARLPVQDCNRGAGILVRVHVVHVKQLRVRRPRIGLRVKVDLFYVAVEVAGIVDDVAGIAAGLAHAAIFGDLKKNDKSN